MSTPPQDKPPQWRCGYCHRTAAKCRRRGVSPVCDGCRAHLAERGKKFCSRCRRPQPLGRFDRVGRGDGRGDGRRAVCQACRLPTTRAAKADYARRWRASNRDAQRAYARAYNARNPERVKRYRREAYLNWKMRASARLRAGGGDR